MSMVSNEEKTQMDRRRNVLRFDRSISLGTLITLIGSIITALLAYRGVIDHLDHIERSAIKSDVMWEHFIREHSDISPDDLKAVR